jgi:hypothetical protein
MDIIVTMFLYENNITVLVSVESETAKRSG